MLKKLILTSALCLTLTAGFPSAPSVVQSEQTVQTAVQEVADDRSKSDPAQEIQDAAQRDQQKFNQAEKAENLKEKDSWGGALTIMSMCIVLLALIVLSILFMCFGKVSSSFHSKKKKEASGLNPITAGNGHDDSQDSGEVIAAIALALHEHFGGKHDIEDTILTIKKLRRAYSPWNSKIYNMREVPQIRKRK